MTELDEELGPIALELIDEFGQLVAYKVTGANTYDPDTRTSTTTEIDLSFKVTPPEYFDGKTVQNSGGLIETTDYKIIGAALSFGDNEPTPDDKVQIGGKWCIVKQVWPIYSGELVCVYIMQARR